MGTTFKLTAANDSTRTPADLYSLFRQAAGRLAAADEALLDTNPHWAVVDAIGAAATREPAYDIQNIAHRIAVALGLQNEIFDRARRGIDVGDVLDKQSDLMELALRGLDLLAPFDVRCYRSCLSYERPEAAQ